MAYSDDMRRLVLDYVNSGGSKVEAAKRFKVSRNSIYEWLKLGEDIRSQRTGPKGSRLDTDALERYYKESPDKKLEPIAQLLGVNATTVSRNLKKLGYSRKKNVEI